MTKKRYEKKRPSLCYKLIKRLIRAFYGKYGIRGAENIPGEPVVIVSNHCQLHGPLAYELYSPVKRYTWCAGEMMEWKEIPGYAFKDFWSAKPKWTHPFFRLLSFMIAPLAVLLFNNAETVPVYRDRRLIGTLRTSVRLMEEGNSMVIFPEYASEHNGILCDFRDGFVDLAKLYHKRTGKAVCFVPAYLSPELRLISFGAPVRFDPGANASGERARIKAQLMERITALARELPPHTVVPYLNIPKKRYPKNRAEE